ncbi:MAG: glycosyltransferase [Candidatus Staskawiczbacteria bacterium]|nr:glycosyltransferase [Candidatus Staskawiczbacteria bacterium]
MNENFLVSIVLPTCNGSRYLKQSIDSCLNQTYKNLELIIVDDGSSDNTADIIKSYSDRRIRYFKHEKNLGLPAALNTGFAKSAGEYLTWTSDDNFYAKKAIARMAEVLEKNKDIGFVYANFYLIDEAGKILKPLRAGSPKSLDNNNFIGACFLYRREVYEKIGEYDLKLRLAEDYNYWLRIRQSFKMKRINDFLYYYRHHQNSLTSLNKLAEIAAQVQKAGRGYVSCSAEYYHQGKVFFYKKDYKSAKKSLIKSVASKLFNFASWKLLIFVCLTILSPAFARRIKKIKN